MEWELGVPIPGVILPPEQWSRTALKRLPAREPLDIPALFGREAPLVLDVGCGNGRSTISSALARPDHDHLGVDILPLVIRYATKRANQRGLTNVRFAVRDGESFVRELMPNARAVEVAIYHPQPCAARGVRGTRLLSPSFLAGIYRVLRPGGTLILQTDNPDYWEEMRALVPCFFDVEEHEGVWPDAPEGRTRREILARRRGLRIYRAIGTRREGVVLAEAIMAAARVRVQGRRREGAWLDLDREEDTEG